MSWLGNDWSSNPILKLYTVPKVENTAVSKVLSVPLGGSAMNMKKISIITLDVIIECTVLISILVQQTESISIGKVLKLYKAVHAVPEKE